MIRLDALVLQGSIEPIALAIQGVTVSRHSHLLFTLTDGRVIDSTLSLGGVQPHAPVKHFGQYRRTLRLSRFYDSSQIDTMTARAIACIGVEYDTKGILKGYLPNRPETDWQKRLWCFEFGRVVMDGFMPFDHRPDRAVGRHWLDAMNQLEKHGGIQ